MDKMGLIHTHDCTNEHKIKRTDKTIVDSGTHAGNHVPVSVLRSILKVLLLVSSSERQKKGEMVKEIGRESVVPGKFATRGSVDVCCNIQSREYKLLIVC